MRSIAYCAALAAAAGLLAADGALGANPGPTFVDPAGDAAGAPDVTAVLVTSGTTAVTFTIRTAHAGAWVDAAAILDLDADADSATGNAGGRPGYELAYVLHSLHDSFTLDRSNGEHVERPAATASLSGATLTITVPLSELGNGPTIGFRISTPARTGEDVAPADSKPEWRFSPAATVRSIAATFTPAAPAHGRRFAVARVRTAFSDGTTGTAPAACTARLRRSPLGGSCRWRIPASASGKTLSIVVRAAGLRRAYSFRVR